MKLFEKRGYDTVATIPNFITFTGTCLLFVYVWGFLTNHKWIMFGSLFLSGVSDLLDGWAARKLNQATKVGEIIDPLRDKLFFVAIISHLCYLFVTQNIINPTIFLSCMFIIAITEGIALGIAAVNILKWKNHVLENRTHTMRKVRQASYAFVVGIGLIDFYFLGGVFTNISISFSWILVVISIISLINCANCCRVYSNLNFQP